MVQEVLNISTILTVVHFLFEKSSQGFHKSLMLLIEQWLMGAETHAWVKNYLTETLLDIFIIN